MSKSAPLKHAPASASHDVLVSAAAQIVSAYVAGRAHESHNLMQLTADVYHCLSGLAQETVQPVATSGSHRAPVVAVEESVKADYLVCLEDGKQVKMLKRYLKSNYNMTPEQYRQRWDLPLNYPMVAPNYAKVRSQLAKDIGLGRRGLPHVAKRMSDARVSLR
jgi:predicted transcriptional regulator